MPVLPIWLVEVIWVTLAMRPNCRSSGVATAVAIVSGLAPGKPGVHADRRKIYLRQRRYRQKSKRNRT